MPRGSTERQGRIPSARWEEAITEGACDAVAFGVKFIANPDLPVRIKTGALLNEPDPETFYGSGAQVYVDYPELQPGSSSAAIRPRRA
jgi:N-ethylmaleimide reductase